MKVLTAKGGFRLCESRVEGSKVAETIGSAASLNDDLVEGNDLRQCQIMCIPLNVISSSGILITDSGDCDHPPERSEV